MIFHAITDPGRVRTNNEDCIYAKQSVSYRERGVFIVADGVGGQNAGEVASRICCQYVGENVLGWLDSVKQDVSYSDAENIIMPSVNRANDAILRRMESQPECKGMGSTLTACITLGKKPNSDIIQAVILNQGDSVCFAIGKKITRLTREHTLVAELLASGNLTPEEAKTHPQRNMITHAMGMNPLPKPDLFKVEIKKHIQLLLSTDGLLNHLSDEEIFMTVTSHNDLKSACETLLNKANQRGGVDNISVILARRDDYAMI